jgi:hypothetical protein
MAQDQDKEKLHPKVDSGDVSGRGRERRPDEEYPKHRSAGEFGTHGGPSKHGKKASEQRQAPGGTPSEPEE